MAAFGIAVLLLARPHAQVPSRLDDREFWSLVDGMSEAGGPFVSDNVISNEIEYQRPIPALQAAGHRGAYIGVGPEQNFTYVAALKPSIAFIVDIRRGNRDLHLLYKALFELSSDRADFLARLFARGKPEGLTTKASARELLDRFAAALVDEAKARRTLTEVENHLERVHGFLLAEDDRRGIEDMYRALYHGGPTIRGDFGGGSWIPSFVELMTQTDAAGVNHSFLASEEGFTIVKDYQARNLVVPLVGDFAGPKTLKAIGTYLAGRHDTVATFYTSNVEEYLFKAESWPLFVASLRTLPTTPQSAIVRTFFTHTQAGLLTLIDSIQGTTKAADQIGTYGELIGRSGARAR